MLIQENINNVYIKYILWYIIKGWVVLQQESFKVNTISR